MRVNPVVHAAATRLLGSASFPSVWLHRQKLSIRGGTTAISSFFRLLRCAVPVYRVSYSWEGKKMEFFVVGVDRQVHAPGYPKAMNRIIVAMLIVIAIIALIVYLFK